MGRRRVLPIMGDAPEREAARVMGLSPERFAEVRAQLHRRGFPLPDVTTGMYDLDAIAGWRRRRHPQILGDGPGGSSIDPGEFKRRLEETFGRRKPGKGDGK